MTITYHKKRFNPFTLQGWSDSDWGGDLNTRHSTSSFVFTLAGGAISWQSRKQQTIALSTTKVEYVAMALASKEGLWIQRLLQEMGISKLPPFTLYIDNMSCITLVKNPKHHRKTKHVDFKFHFIRELTEFG